MTCNIMQHYLVKWRSHIRVEIKSFSYICFINTNSGVLGLIKQFVFHFSSLQWTTRFARKATIPSLNTKAKLLDKVRSTTDQSQFQVRDRLFLNLFLHDWCLLHHTIR